MASSGSCSSGNEKDPSKDQNNAQVSMLLPAQAASLLSPPVTRMEEEEKKEEVGLLKKGIPDHLAHAVVVVFFFIHSISCPILVMAVRLQGCLTVVLARSVPLWAV